MPTSTFRVLVIEDNEADIFLIREVFRSCEPECRITLARNQEEARLLLSREPFDLLLTNGGREVDFLPGFLGELRRNPRFASLPVALFSASYDAHSAYAAGVNVFVRKGIEIEEYEQKLKALLHFWKDVAEPPALGRRFAAAPDGA